MMLDRGQNQDWFTSREIIVEAVLGGLGIYLFLVHMADRRRPFIPPALFKDRELRRRPRADVRRRHHAGVADRADGALAAERWPTTRSTTAGLLMAPRGIGTLVAMVLGGRLVDARRSALAGRDRPGDAVLVVLGDDRLDAGRVRAAS